MIIDIDARLPFADVDPGLLERALANVIDNGLTWSQASDVVRVEAGSTANHVDIRVVDHGPGIPVGQARAGV